MYGGLHITDLYCFGFEIEIGIYMNYNKQKPRYLKLFTVLLVVYVFSTVPMLFANEKNVQPYFPDGHKPKTGTVSFAHVSLMHPYFEEPTYLLGKYIGEELDSGQFEYQLKSGWQPDQKYQALTGLVETVFKNNVDIISISGVTSREMAKSLVYSMYFATLHKWFVPVAGFDSNTECDLCRHMTYSETAQSLIFSLYPVRDKVIYCEFFHSQKLNREQALGCFLGGRVAFGGTSFSFLTVNMAELPVIQEAQSLLIANKLRTSLEKSRKSVVDDYLTSVREIFRPKGQPGRLPNTLHGEHVIYSGFWGMAANSLHNNPMFKQSINQLYGTLAVKIMPVEPGLASLKIMSDLQALQYFQHQGILLPQSDSLVDFIGFSTLNAAPIAMSELSTITPEVKGWPGHHIVHRTMVLSTEPVTERIR